LICILISGGCGEKMKKEMGFGKKSPDEYQVIANKPLSMPPNYELIPPSEEEQNEVTLNKDKDVGEKKLTEADKSILVLSDADRADPEIRKVLDEEQSVLKVEKSLLDKILAGEALISTEEEIAEEIIDPDAERARITKKAQEDATKNKNEVPVIKREE
jgi:hypothetical protein